MKTPAALAVIAAALAVPGIAQAAQPKLSLARADSAAHRIVASVIDDWNVDYDATDPADSYVKSFDLDRCQRVRASKAECDVTYWLNDGTGCDDIIVLQTTRRNKLRESYGSDIICDGDPDTDD